MTIKPSISIFGNGRVGGALQNSCDKAGYKIDSVYSRNLCPSSIDELGEVIFLTVQDSEIENLAKKLSSAFDDLSKNIIVHCSGTLSSSILKSLEKKGSKIASFHPLKAITLNEDSLEGIWFDMEGDEGALNVLEKITKDLGANCFEVKPEAKPLLHASAVVSSNYLVSLLKLATDIAETGGIDPDIALKALVPLAESSLENIKKKGFEKALTGPIERGDFTTIQEHLKQLKENPDLLNLYKALGHKTISIAKGLNENQIRDLKQLLD